MERLTDKNHNAINKCSEYSSCYSCHKENCYIKEIEEKLGELEDILESWHIENLEELKTRLHDCQVYHLKNNSNETLIHNLKNELAELKQKAIVLPFEFNKPIYKLCPKCNDRQTDCKNCAWGGCGFNQCYDICHKGNKGQIICEVIFKKDNCNVSWNALRFISEHWGEYYFATKAEAEAKLKELGE